MFFNVAIRFSKCKKQYTLFCSSHFHDRFCSASSPSPSPPTPSSSPSPASSVDAVVAFLCVYTWKDWLGSRGNVGYDNARVQHPMCLREPRLPMRWTIIHASQRRRQRCVRPSNIERSRDAFPSNSTSLWVHSPTKTANLLLGGFLRTRCACLRCVHAVRILLTACCDVVRVVQTRILITRWPKEQLVASEAADLVAKPMAIGDFDDARTMAAECVKAVVYFDGSSEHRDLKQVEFSTGIGL